MTSLSIGWECSRCTYRHYAPGNRCVMCNELKVTRQQMRDFIMGKTMNVKKRPKVLTVNAAQEAEAEAEDAITTSHDHDVNTDFTVTTISGAAHPAAAAAAQQQQQQELQSNNPFTIAAQASAQQKHQKQNNKPSTATNTAMVAYAAGPVPLALHLADTWIYPTADAYPRRQYQFDISQSAILQNTLVSLPTGLGKTLIAAVVLYNFYRWFPTGKVIFLAPTLPLVDQQVQACYEIMGIPATDTALLTGKVPAPQRTTIWHNKRVFFCTPQTVQKDLEQNRLNASRVVCVVLDEAHKATGEYAYCKVIQQLEDAGAKFRIVGLSATPGTSIKAIQQVVQVLRINTIEARSDNDADVKQYIHERQNEVIIVKQVAASKVVERCLDEIIGPVLDRLRNMGVLPRTLTGNATMTSYNLIKAREDFYKRQERDNSAIGYFSAGIAFIQMRSDLHKHGIGIVRHKLDKLRTGRQTGYTSTIVKSPAFLKLWEEVSNSSCDPDATGNTVEDRLRNNPKLSKLKEILEEHFERARACGTSSRAIVFSQFRDSVSEIVHVLNTSRPLILARQFIGQGNGSGKQTSNESGEAGTKGMKQDEQKRVIQEFRANVHNTLVCTSIGEEGLDIGSVDIIVNFDCLSSPIRMLQRVGRTGRKREGRVVSLIAEGPEERTLARSRQNERNLVHALKAPKSFTVAHVVPMFPKDPVVREQNMTISQNFHMSQVGGAARKKRSRSSSCPQLRKKLVGSGKWQLCESQELHRALVLGRLKDIHVSVLSRLSSAQLRRRFIAARAAFTVQNNNANKHRLPNTAGRTTKLLLKIELSHGKKAGESSVSAALTRLNRRESGVDCIFPFTIANSNCAEDSAAKYRPIPKAIGLSAAPVFESSGAEVSCRPAGAAEHATDSASLRSGPVQHPIPPRQNSVSLLSIIPTAMVSSLAADPLFDTNITHKGSLPSTTHGRNLHRNPHADGPRDTLQHRAHGQVDDIDDFVPHCPAEDPLGIHGVHRTDETLAASRKAAVQEVGAENRDDFLGSSHTNDDDNNFNDFRLPSQDDSSVSDGNVDEDDEGQELVRGEIEVASEMFLSQHEKPGFVKDKTVGELPHQAGDVAFRLPTQDSSSEDEDIGDDHGDDVDSPLAVEAKEACRTHEQLETIATSAEIHSSQGPALSNSQRSFDTGQVRFSVDSSASVPFVGVRNYTPDSEPLQRRKNSRKRVLAVLDTPDSAVEAPPLDSQGELQNAGSLSNTQDQCENIVCAVCHGHESPDFDPIILCDGPGNGSLCDIAVHVSCYSADVDLDDPEKDWRCDRCAFFRMLIAQNVAVPVDELHCCLCGRGDGALKLQGQSLWKHQRCKPGTAQMKQIRRRNKAARKPSPRVAEVRRPLLDLPHNEDGGHTDSARKKRRHEIFKRFIDDEADADSDGDSGDDVEEANVREMEEEEEELARDFLNDSSQLGFTQDALDRADPDTDRPGYATHRALDLEYERKRQFATPALNRRMLNRQGGSQWSEASGSVPDSDRGLGRMHFIRSVLEHHRNGGRAEEIEEFYQQLEEDSAHDQEE